MEQNLIKEINKKELELNNLKEQYNTELETEKIKVLKSPIGFNKVLYLLGFVFESSCSRTPQYLEFHRIFKREFTAVLKPFIKEVDIHKPNHFDITGFFKLNDDRIFYFSVGDLRWNKESVMIRTAKDFKDYSGGSNNEINLDKDFIANLFKFLNLEGEQNGNL